MNSKQIEYTLELAKTKNFNRAAENFFITQPALSYQIKRLETEVGFTIFERSAKGVVLTLAGQTFCERITLLQQELKAIIEDCRNLNRTYDDVVRICVPFRTAIHYLPEAIETFNKLYPNIFVEVTIDSQPNQYQQFLQGKYDLFYAIQSSITPQKDTQQIHLYDSHIYLVVNHHDVLSQLTAVTSKHLKDRTLLVGGGSPKELRQLQQQLITQLQLKSITSANHETTLTNIAAHRGICLVPGLLNDYNHEFKWIPFKPTVQIPCVLCRHQNNQKAHIITFIDILKDYYQNKNNPSEPKN
ncbi:LysR family transcriptional regulator [Staphylococcus americanisciuri]|uniref:LysR family transcriptional regulator n=1 Tax=Staphylococcus americanisciuri TaxID=2973940 RepID=A0ABT2F1M7_9STAP|nr:LysR family transcriptional regulator [Staphylococcus americanisciuri]MCS4486257.1 LysR family transcriptional regulator [Staphylococcus americanisciuri]